MRIVRVLEEAADEAAEAAAWYEREMPGLGESFYQAVEDALDLLEEGMVPLSPTSDAANARGVKRLILKRFPYDVVVRESATEIVVLAFAHHSRRPGYWRGREAE